MTTQKISNDPKQKMLSTESFASSLHTIVEARLAHIEQRTEAMTKFICTIDDPIFF